MIWCTISPSNRTWPKRSAMPSPDRSERHLMRLITLLPPMSKSYGIHTFICHFLWNTLWTFCSFSVVTMPEMHLKKRLNLAYFVCFLRMSCWQSWKSWNRRTSRRAWRVWADYPACPDPNCLQHGPVSAQVSSLLTNYFFNLLPQQLLYVVQHLWATFTNFILKITSQSAKNTSMWVILITLKSFI